MIEARERHWTEAVEHLRAAARVDPSPRVLTPLAFVLAGAGRAEETLETGRRSLALDSDQPELRGLVDELAKAR